MRTSRLFGRTLRDVPSGVEVTGHGLLLRAGFVRQLAAGIFSYLPLARRSLDKVQGILREEMDACGGQEVSMPVVQPADAWERSGRYGTIGAELARLRDRRDRAMVLAMTHEEVVAGLVAITPACGWVGPMGSIAIGAAGALVCLLAVTKLKAALGA